MHMIPQLPGGVKPADQAPHEISRERTPTPDGPDRPLAGTPVEVDGNPSVARPAVPGSDLLTETSLARTGVEEVFRPDVGGGPVSWRNTRRNSPCAICGRTSWCSYSECETWAVCRREPSHSTLGAGKETSDKAGVTAWIYRLVPAPPRAEGWEEPRHHHAEAGAERADPDILNKVYSLIIGNLPVCSSHLGDLARRGLTDAKWATRRGYRTLGKGRARAVQAVIRAGLESSLPGVPGLFVQRKEGGKPYWTIAGAGGLLIPICDERSRIVALSVRVDGATEGKYRYVSSKHHGGASPGSPVHFPPMKVRDRSTIRITEGALKADVATKLSGHYTVGLPGVGSWQAGVEAAKALGAEAVRVGFDADARTNRTVSMFQRRLVGALRDAGIRPELEVWDQADGKGIDDLLASGKTPVVLTDAGEIDRALAEIASAAEAAAPTTPAEGIESDDDPHRLARLYLEAVLGGRQADGKVLRYWRAQFWRWTGTAFRHAPDGEVRAEVNAAAKREFDRLAHEALKGRLASPGKGKPPRARVVNTALVGNVVQALGGLTLLPGDVEQPCWLTEGREPEPRGFAAVANGLLDLDRLLAGRRDVLLPHSPRWFSPSCLPYPFDPDAACPRWLAFLEKNLEGDGERIDLLGEWFGYNLTHDTAHQKFLVLEGEGANGKSVICAALTATLGKLNVANVPLEKFADRFSLTQTLGRLANVAAEVGELDKAAEGTLKMFTAGDRMMFDRKGIAPVEAMPSARLTMATNNRPRFSDRSGGLWRRMILFPLRVVIGDADKVRGMDKPEWWEASGELPGILNWAVAGLHRLRRQGRFTASSVCSDALGQYREEANPARMFLAGTCAAKEGAGVIKALLYHHYREWCVRTGPKPLSNVEFGKEVFRTFPSAKNGKIPHAGKRLDGYLGVAFDPDAADPVAPLLPELPAAA